MTATFKIEGLQDLERAFADLENVNQRKASARRAMKKAAQPMADDAARLAPREFGTLSESIKVGTVLSKRQRALHRKMFRDDRAAVEMFVGAGPFSSAHNQEFGNEHNPPQPFMRPALDSNAQRYMETIGRELWADIDKTAKRAANKASRLASTAAETDANADLLRSGLGGE
jgi:HK97 gp10 family phage protein